MTDKVIVIGASRGIGLAFVRQYRAAGATVVGTARSDEGLAAVGALGARALRLDVADAASAASLGPALAGESFELAIVNAGVYGPRLAAPDTPSQADFDHVMHTNVLGPMRVLPSLAAALAPGAKVAVISSQMGSIGGRSNGGGWLYRASKAAVNSVMRDMAFVLEGRAVLAALHPGWVRTDMGGAGADLAVDDSVARLRATIAAFDATSHGRFFDLDGRPLPW